MVNVVKHSISENNNLEVACDKVNMMLVLEHVRLSLKTTRSYFQVFFSPSMFG